MTKREFINILNDELKNSLDNDNLKKQLDYYDDYISTEVQNGEKESDVLSELGDPRLIAKTIKQVSGDDLITDDTSYNENKSKHSHNNSSYSNSSNNNTNSNYYITNFGALGCIVFILIFLFIIIFVLRLLGVVVFGSIAAGSGSFIGFIITFIILYYLFNSFRRR